MILLAEVRRFNEEGIPRESGDDPFVPNPRHDAEVYSPRERG